MNKVWNMGLSFSISFPKVFFQLMVLKVLMVSPPNNDVWKKTFICFTLQLLMRIIHSNLEVYFTSALRWPARYYGTEMQTLKANLNMLDSMKFSFYLQCLYHNTTFMCIQHQNILPFRHCKFFALQVGINVTSFSSISYYSNLRLISKIDLVRNFQSIVNQKSMLVAVVHISVTSMGLYIGDWLYKLDAQINFHVWHILRSNKYA